MPGMGGEAPLGYSLPQGFQQHHVPNAAATVSYLSASPAVHGQHVNTEGGAARRRAWGGWISLC